ncbi:hypothetical protein DXG03_001052 [Asterophora parasitica]|uniref:AB hydrolase-1 domain-containing protein n=1 Tax=Asterophora parasitica TaxID=117018 RepID=A0A9P7FZD8_9AGAR|nr:hypothetical protein DXG03_001052 [Asterophora parasitica]
MVWKVVAPQLASNGYRVLVYGAPRFGYLISTRVQILVDLYGRGYSDAPQTTYDANLYTVQLALLMQHLRWDKAIIGGVSMGGGIATAFVAQFPQLADDNVVLIASAGLMEYSIPRLGQRYIPHCEIHVLPARTNAHIERPSPSTQPFFPHRLLLNAFQKYLQRLILRNSTHAPAEKKENPVTEVRPHLTGAQTAYLTPQ